MEKKTNPQTETKTSTFNITLKEKDGEFYSRGYIATTHPDRALDSSINVVGDILSKNVLNQIADYINNGIASIKGIGSTRTVSLQHDWVKEQNPDLEPAGMALPPVTVKQLDDGHFGVEAETHHNKSHPKFDDILYKVKHGYFPGYSIEYEPGDYSIVEHEGQRFRFLKTINNFVGYAFASARKIANPHALLTGFGYKEIEQIVKEDSMMEEEIKKEEPSQVNPQEQEPVKSDEVTTEEISNDSVPSDDGEVVEPQPEPESKEVKLDVKETEIKEAIANYIKSALDNEPVKSKVLKTKEGDTMEGITIKELNTALKEGADSFEAVVSGNDLINKGLSSMKEGVKYDFNTSLKIKVAGKGLKIVGGFKEVQVKAPPLDSATNTSSYTQQPVEFADLFLPGLIDTFNNRTDYHGFLRKENHIGGTVHQWKMITNRDPESNDTFVDFDDVSVKKNYSSKENYQTPIKIARRGVSVADTTLRYSSASLGDLFQREVEIQMNEMMVDVERGLFAEKADGDGNGPLGLEAVADSTGNATLYGKSRTTANRLKTASLTGTLVTVSGVLTEDALRNGFDLLETEGSRKEDLAIITNPLGRSRLFNLLDGQRRFPDVEATFGFNRMMVPSHDGVPIIISPFCTSTVHTADNAKTCYYIIDTNAAKIVVAMAPQLISLAKVGAGTEAYLEYHFAHVYEQPRRIHMLDDVRAS